MPGEAGGATGAGGLAPFDKHPANPGALNSSAAQIAAQARQTVDVTDQTLGAYAPAIENWEGIAASELAAAPKPLITHAADMNLSLTWASIAIKYWAKQVEAFNAKVDELLAQLASLTSAPTQKDPLAPAYMTTAPTSGGVIGQLVDNARQAAIADLRRQWYEAYQTYIVAGAATFKAMLRDGPTDRHVATARAAGLVPSKMAQVFNSAFKGVLGELQPDTSTALGTAAIAPWLAGRAFFASDLQLELLKRNRPLYERMTFLPGVRDPYARATARWTAVSKVGKVAGPLLAGGTGAADQWLRDSGRSDLTTGERVGRAAGRGLAMAGTAAAAGLLVATAPVSLPVAIGSAILAGAIGSYAGDQLAPYLVELGEKVGKAVEDGIHKLSQEPTSNWPATAF